MPDAGQPEFTFSLALSHDPRFDRMLADLTSAVLRHVGYPPEAVAEMIGVLQSAMAGQPPAGGRECQVAFHAQDGQLRIALTFDGGAQWSTVQPLPWSD